MSNLKYGSTNLENIALWAKGIGGGMTISGLLSNGSSRAAVGFGIYAAGELLELLDYFWQTFTHQHELNCQKTSNGLEENVLR